MNLSEMSAKTCECGCGQEVNKGSRFILGHLKGKNNPNFKGGLPHCKDCGKLISYNAIFCASCFRKSKNNPMYGKTHTSEARAKIRESRKKYTGENHPLYGKHPSKETLEKKSRALKGKHLSPATEFKEGDCVGNKNPHYKDGRCSKQYYCKDCGKKIHYITALYGDGFCMSCTCKGERSPHWKGGISNAPYTFNFNDELKELIRKRDNYKCQICNCPEIENIQKLSIHHIDYNKSNPSPDNLIALCKSCHSKTNFNPEYWVKLFKEKINEFCTNGV